MFVKLILNHRLYTIIILIICTYILKNSILLIHINSKVPHRKKKKKKCYHVLLSAHKQIYLIIFTNS